MINRVKSRKKVKSAPLKPETLEKLNLIAEEGKSITEKNKSLAKTRPVIYGEE